MIVAKGTHFDREIITEGGVFLIDKPLTWTSFDVVNKFRNLLRKAFDTKKIKVGHAGTLDPLATGLLIICVGKKTKEIELYQGLPKVYSGTITFGAVTPTFDCESDISEVFEYQHIDDNELEKTLKIFEGEITQVPPIYSAVKIAGTSSYHLARRGVEVTLTPRPITIYKFRNLGWVPPVLSFDVTCSKGTYIRSLANDVGKSLRSGAYLSALRREQIGDYNVHSAWSIDDLVQRLQNLTF